MSVRSSSGSAWGQALASGARACYGAPVMPDPISKFSLAHAFVETAAPLATLALCEARLQLDARWPWIVLIPRRAGARELADLALADRVGLMEEIVLAGRAVSAIGQALGRPVDKLNVGALGNIIPQLHVHVVGRRTDDIAWPGPVWGVGAALPYEDHNLAGATGAARSALAVRTGS